MRERRLVERPSLAPVAVVAVISAAGCAAAALLVLWAIVRVLTAGAY